MTTRNTSRRAVLAGIGAAPAIGLASATAAPATECSFPELAARYAAIYRRWLTQQTVDEAISAKFNKRFFEVYGIHPPEWEFPDGAARAAYRAACDRVSAEMPDSDPVDESGVSIAWNEIHDELYSACEAILAQPARSLADIVVQARACALVNQEYWTEPLEQENETGQELRALVNSICRLAGVEALPGADVKPLCEDDEVQS